MKQLKNIQDSIYSLSLSTEFAYIFGQEVKEHNPDFNFEEVKIASLLYIEELLKKDIIIAVENHGEEKQLGNSIQETIEIIDVRWIEYMEFPELYDIVYFHNSKWFMDKLKKSSYFDSGLYWAAYADKGSWSKDLLKVNEQEIQRKFQDRLMHQYLSRQEQNLVWEKGCNREKQEKPLPKLTLSKKNFLQRLWHRFITEN